MCIRISICINWLGLLENNFVSSFSASEIAAKTAKNCANRQNNPKPSKIVQAAVCFKIALIPSIERLSILTTQQGTIMKVIKWQTVSDIITFITLWYKNGSSKIIAPRRFIFCFVWRILLALRFLVIFSSLRFVCFFFSSVTCFTHLIFD